MDCLDRTNVAQSVIARYILKRQLIDAGIISNPDIDQELYFVIGEKKNFDAILRTCIKILHLLMLFVLFTTIFSLPLFILSTNKHTHARTHTQIFTYFVQHSMD